jgi:UDP-N-acetylglucosamine 2-epimerase (non-hydrolysing)
LRIINVVGARPNFMKIGPILNALKARSSRAGVNGGAPIEQLLVHTGQHYDRAMSELFFEQLEIPVPDVNLGVGSGSHAAQTAEVMVRFERVCLEQRPTHVLVVGDVNSTIACALVAAKMGITVVHVEAGLRSFDRSMPEEINRILTDSISDLLFTTEESANENLRREGVDGGKIHFVGNVMIDTLLRHRAKAEETRILEQLGLENGTGACMPYGVLTLHRPASVDDKECFREILGAVEALAQRMPIIFPIHPRTKAKAEQFGFQGVFTQGLAGSGGVHPRPGIFIIDPLGYLEFLHLMAKAEVVLTDSGGIQEETTILGVPCVTLRDSTERPVTVTEGTNVIAGTTRGSILARTTEQLARFARGKPGEPVMARPSVPPLWDGRAAERIADILVVKEESRG